MHQITDDKRLIGAINTVGEGGHYWIVGLNAVTKIESYLETSQMAHVPWFKIWHGDQLAERVNGAFVERIQYIGPDIPF